MSHFTVLVNVPNRLVEEQGNIEKAVGKMLAPYQENNMGDCPKEYLQFHDETPNLQQEWEANIETVREGERVTLHKGISVEEFNHLQESGEITIDWKPQTFLSKCSEVGEICELRVEDEKVKSENSLFAEVTNVEIVKQEFSTAQNMNKILEARITLQKTDKTWRVPIQEHFLSFDEYATKYGGYKKDPDLDRYGYWENPNRKWDWWVIGGRWSGLLPVRDKEAGLYGDPCLMKLGQILHDQGDKDGFMSVLQPEKAQEVVEENINLLYEDKQVDICRIRDLDMEKLERQGIDGIESLWIDIQRSRDLLEKLLSDVELSEEESKYLRDYIGPFGDVTMNLMSIGLINTKDEEFSKKENEDKEEYTLRRNKSLLKILQGITKESLIENHSWNFGFSTFAVLNEHGWHAAGEMGWFGIDDSNVDSRQVFKRGYVDHFLKSADPDSWAVIVDCHI